MKETQLTKTEIKYLKMFDRRDIRIRIAREVKNKGKWTTGSGGSSWTYSRASDLRRAVAICGNKWFYGKEDLENHLKKNVGNTPW